MLKTKNEWEFKFSGCSKIKKFSFSGPYNRSQRESLLELTNDVHTCFRSKGFVFVGQFFGCMTGLLWAQVHLKELNNSKYFIVFTMCPVLRTSQILTRLTNVYTTPPNFSYLCSGLLRSMKSTSVSSFFLLQEMRKILFVSSHKCTCFVIIVSYLLNSRVPKGLH